MNSARWSQKLEYIKLHTFSFKNINYFRQNLNLNVYPGTIITFIVCTFTTCCAKLIKFEINFSTIMYIIYSKSVLTPSSCLLLYYLYTKYTYTVMIYLIDNGQF